MNDQENKILLLEYRLFNMACIISASAALAIALIDIFITGHSFSVVLDISAFVIFTIFYYLSRSESMYPRLVIPFVVILYALINLSWFYQGGGFNISDAIIFFLIFITSVLILPAKYRKYLVVVTGINVLVLVVAENLNNDLRFHYSDRSMEIFVSDIFIILLFAIGGYLVINFKRKYEKLSTELIEAYEKIRQSNRVLEMTVHNRTADLKKANKELDRLFYRSSHDFRRPLTTLMGIYEVARLMQLDKASMELLWMMHQTVENMDSMLKKFYNLYEISHFTAEEVPASLSEIVDRHEQAVHNEGHILKTTIDLKHYDDKDPRNRLIDIILFNLIENALIFNDNKHSELLLKITEEKDNLKLIFKDNGIGIEESFYHAIFDMYFRSSEKSRGNGMGLYVVKTALEKLQGEVKVKSKLGEYTQFEINIPV